MSNLPLKVQYNDYNIHKHEERTDFSTSSQFDHDPLDEKEKGSVLTRHLDASSTEITKVSNCIYCRNPLESTTYKYIEKPYQRMDVEIDALLSQCKACNWWYIQKKEFIDNEQNSDCLIQSLDTYEGIIHKFDVRAIGPLFESMRSLIKKPRELVEERIKSILAQHNDTEVRYLVESVDKTNEFIFVNGSTDICIRLHYDFGKWLRELKLDDVDFVEKFLGATIDDNTPSGIFFSTRSSPDTIDYCSFAPTNIDNLIELLNMEQREEEPIQKIWSEIKNISYKPKK